MAIRDVAPLSERQWAIVQEMMRRGPTKESVKVVKRALRDAEKIKRDYDF